MKTVSAVASNCQYLAIRQFGIEDISENAKWGPSAHNQHVIHYVLKGRGYFNGAEVRKGQGFLIHANEWVQYYGDPNDPWQYFWVTFSGNAFDEICNEYISANENNIFDYGESTKLYELARWLFSVKIISQPKALSVFYDVLSLNIRETSTIGNTYITEAKNLINFQLDRPLSVSDIAAELGISDRYLYNLFVKYQGQSPKQFINEVKIKHAETLLQNSRIAISEIAASVGYYDALAFSRFFSKKKGVSPSEYRRMCLK